MLDKCKDLEFNQECDVNALQSIFGLKFYTIENRPPENLRNHYLLEAMLVRLKADDKSNQDLIKKIKALKASVTTGKKGFSLPNLRKEFEGFQVMSPTPVGMDIVNKILHAGKEPSCSASASASASAAAEPESNEWRCAIQ